MYKHCIRSCTTADAFLVKPSHQLRELSHVCNLHAFAFLDSSQPLHARSLSLLLAISPSLSLYLSLSPSLSKDRLFSRKSRVGLQISHGSSSHGFTTGLLSLLRSETSCVKDALDVALAWCALDG